MAEGLDSNRPRATSLSFAPSNGKRSAARFDLDEIRAGHADDPSMQQGDVVVVDTSTAKTVMNALVKVPFWAFVPLL